MVGDEPPGPVVNLCGLAARLPKSLDEVASGDSGLLNTCGLAFLRAGETEKARELLRRADWLYGFHGPASPDRGENLFLLSIASSALGLKEEARDAFEKASKLAPMGQFRKEAERLAGRN